MTKRLTTSQRTALTHMATGESLRVDARRGVHPSTARSLVAAGLAETRRVLSMTDDGALISYLRITADGRDALVNV